MHHKSVASCECTTGLWLVMIQWLVTAPLNSAAQRDSMLCCALLCWQHFIVVLAEPLGGSHRAQPCTFVHGTGLRMLCTSKSQAALCLVLWADNVARPLGHVS